MQVGRHTYGHENIKVLWEKCGEVVIGNFCSIADDIKIFLGGDHAVDWATTYPFGIIKKDVFNIEINQNNRTNSFRNNNVIIGNDVWIGGGVTIMRGVRIGDGAVIARNSHVVRNVAPYTVVGGNPAQFYYNRFDEETVKKLLELKWWNFDDNIINEILPYLCSNNVEELFKICERNGYKK
ncbi:MAG: CatB-related O-acetyltransferase [Candidatus Omnitrophica bacterium]|nr:CatB-related O-acetyltransferase [Candidatus Omnitrophota bacterium]